MNGLNRFMGCMLGGAVGDALGFVIGKDDLKTIHKKYGPYGLRTVLKSAKNGNKSIISDDTQLALFTADGMLWADHDGLEPTEGLYRSYMRWYYTQTERIIRPEQEKWMNRQSHEVALEYDIMGEQALFARRSPGKTCLTALASGKKLSRDETINHSSGNSTVMRAAPIGLFYEGDPEKAFFVGSQAASLTHGNPKAFLSTATISAIIASLAVGKDISTALGGALHILQREPEGTRLLKLLLRSIDEAVTDRNPVRSMKKIGLGKKVDEALALSIYCVLKTGTLKEAVLMACNQDGDSDTCGAICGNIMGTIFGDKAIPKSWSCNLECDVLIRRLSQCLYEHNRLQQVASEAVSH